MPTAADAPAELVKLGQTEALGMMKDHDARIRHIHTHLDDGGGNQRRDFPIAETAHHGFLFFRPKFAMNQSDLMIRESLPPFFISLGGGLGFEGLALLD